MAKHLKLRDLGPTLARDLGKLREQVVLAAHETAGDGAVVCAVNAPRAFGDISRGMVGQSLGDAGARIRSTAPHSAAVEVGSRPHFPPIDPIERWVKLRGMQGQKEGARGVAREMARRIKRAGESYEFTEIKRGPNKGAMRRRKVRGTAVDAPREVALAICRAIAARGTKPTWFMQKSVPTIVKILDAHMRSYLAKAMN